MMDALLKSGVSYDDDDYVDWSDDDDLICTSKFVVSSEEDDEELLTVARAKLKRKKALTRTVVRTSDDDDDEDDNDFEKEMASELSQTMQHLTTSFARSQQKNSVSAGDTSSSHAEKANTTPGDAGKQGNTKRVQFNESCMSEGKEEAKFYDDIYFDSDDSDDNEAAGASSSRRAKEKRRMLTNDELFYDPTLDDRDQAWVDKRRRSYQVTKKRDSKSTGSSNVARPASRPQALPQSDAVLNCPACLTTLCLDCQRHTLYTNQYRAMFVFNCSINWTEGLKIPKKNEKKKEFLRHKRKKNKNRHDQQQTMEQEKMTTSGKEAESTAALQCHQVQQTSASIQENGVDDSSINPESKTAQATTCPTETAPTDGDENPVTITVGGQSLVAAANTFDSSSAEAPPSSSSQENKDIFYPVTCSVCNTKVAVYDHDEVYHFFNVVTSY